MYFVRGIYVISIYKKVGNVLIFVPCDRNFELLKFENNKLLTEMLGDDQRNIEYAIVSGYRNMEKKDYSGGMQIINYLQTHCPNNIKLIPFQSDLGVKVCPNVLAYEFAFDVNTSQAVSYYLFYSGKEARYNKYFK